MLLGSFEIRHEVGDERAARTEADRPIGLTNIRHGREAPAAIESEPRAPRFEIATAEHARPIGPPRRARRPPRVQLVAISGDDQRVARRGAERDDDEAHATMLPGRRERLDLAAPLE